MQFSLSQTHILVLPIISQKAIFYPHRRYETHGKTTREHRTEEKPGRQGSKRKKEKKRKTWKKTSAVLHLDDDVLERRYGSFFV